MCGSGASGALTARERQDGWTSDGKVAIVTGSSSGIGEAVARALAKAGAAVVVNSATSVSAGEAVAASLPAADVRAGGYRRR